MRSRLAGDRRKQSYRPVFALVDERRAAAFDFDSSPFVGAPKKQPFGCFFGAPAGTRTPDTLLKRQVLYLLSYWGVSFKWFFFSAAMPAAWLRWLGWRDSNPLYRSQSPVCYHYTTSQDRFEEKGRRSRPFLSVGWDMGLEPTTPGTTIRCSAN